MKTLLRYIVWWLLIPLWLPGFILWAALLLNYESGGGRSFAECWRTVFSRPKPANKSPLLVKHLL